ncbi:MAG: dicarboxylate/amino acid:cation symporter [Nitrosomonas sp.]|nr:dicarboxylate/amino acid:cation symporter [Nitrosomonas sp.]
MTITQKILIWMVAGLLLGSLINAFAPDNTMIQDYLVNGLFHVVGTIFINLLKMLVVPLVTFSLICGVCGIGDVNKLGRIGVKSLVLFLLTTMLAITLAVFAAVSIGPGKDFQRPQNMQSTFIVPEAPPLTQVIIDLVPSNPVAAFAEGDMLQVIFFTMLFSICLLMLGERGRSVIDGAEKLNEVMMQIVIVVMSMAPYGIFAIMAKTFAVQGIELILPMISYFCVVVAVLIAHTLGTLMIMLRLLGKIDPIQFLKKVRTIQIFAFSTSSSNATIPVTLKTVEKRMGVDNATASFVVPLGATINMDGTAIMQGVAAVFIANVYGIEPGLTGYLTVIGMAVLASIGTAGVPGVGLIMLAMVFNQVGLPVEGIALIMGIDRLLDMLRTAVNVTGDAVVTLIVAKSENSLSLDIFNDPDAGILESVHLPHDAMPK